MNYVESVGIPGLFGLTNAANSVNAALISANNAANSATNASNAQTAAEAAKDIAIQAANIYEDVSLGLANTTNGHYFSVPYSGNPVSSFAIYKNNSGSALYVTSLPSSAFTFKLREAQQAQARFWGSGDLPIITDIDGRILISVNESTGKVSAYGLVDEILSKSLAQGQVYKTQTQQNMRLFVAETDLIPLLTDKDGKILLGVNKTNGKLIADVDFDGAIEEIKVQNHFFGQRKQIAGTITAILTDKDGKVLLGFDSETSKIVGAIEPSSSQYQYNLETLTNKPIERGINHFLFYGQSLSVGATGQSAISTTQPYSNITFTGGVKSTKSGGTGWNAGLDGFKPLIEDNITADYEINSLRGETCCSGAAKYATDLRAIENGFATDSHIILASTAGHGGYSISQLRKGSTDVTHDSTNTVVSPTNWYGVLLDQISAGQTLSAAQSKTYGVPVVGWLQGEANRTMSKSTYISELIALKNEIKADIHAITGRTDPFYFLTYQTPYGAALSDTQVHLAQLEAAQQDSEIILVTPCYFFNSGDGTHLNNVSYTWLGHYFGRAYKQLMSGFRPKWINPISATCVGRVLKIKFDVPVLPLKFDISTLPNTTDKGFKVIDDSGALILSSIIIEKPDTVSITLNRDLSGNPKVRYALDYLGTGCQFTSGASGNLCDSDISLASVNGTQKTMFNVCPHFQLNIIKLS